MPPLELTASDQRYWKSLDEFEDALARRFPAAQAILDTLDNPVSRRRFLKLLGASMGLAGLSSCYKMPAEKIIPYVTTPESFVPSKSLHFATSAFFAGYAKSIVAESHESRPTKLEGNKLNPSVLGKSDLFTQADLLPLYDPNRSGQVLHLGRESTWSEFGALIREQRALWIKSRGEGLRILTNHLTGPTVLADLQNFLNQFPRAAWHSYEPTRSEGLENATLNFFGQRLRPSYDFKKARTILSFDCDFLGPGPQRETYVRDFASWRTPNSPRNNRLYVLESSVSLTGAGADHRWPLRESRVQRTLFELAGLLKMPGFASVNPEPWLKVIAGDLLENRGESLVLGSENYPPELQMVILAMNQRLENLGRTLKFHPSDTHARPLTELAEEMRQGKVETLFIVGANPVYDAPQSLEFPRHLRSVKLVVSHALYRNETSTLSHWHLPESHFLEAWGDGRSFDGVTCFQQPLISPLKDSRSAIELFSFLIGDEQRSGFEALRARWGGPHFDDDLRRGFTGEPAKYVAPPTPRPLPPQVRARISAPVPEERGFEITFRPDPTVWDGRYANNPWLQELPKPLLQLTWSNAIVLNVDDAKTLQVENGDEIEIEANGKSVKGPVLRVPGHPQGMITLYLGYGRSQTGGVADGLGYNAYALQSHLSPGQAVVTKIKKLESKRKLATVHSHWTMEGRDLIVASNFESYRKSPATVVRDELKKTQASLLEVKKNPTAWAMVIDLTACIGCNSCSMACQAENNIPVVGEAEVLNSREMHWIRVDRYYSGSPQNPKTFFQPVPCMQCENAPCEEVCPTAATNHSHDGLNQMTYNRCVGTRYCSNNCPYKVRRFNFFQYSDLKSPLKQLVHNPDVTTRSRGVMEKCTYCVQRIQEARIGADKENREIRDGEIQTACEQACPTSAIVFGDQNDPQSRVRKSRDLPLNFSLLNELGTRPRTTYLASLRNPHPQLAENIGTSNDFK